MRSDNLKFNDIFWNTLGTVIYSAVSLLLSVVIINMTGKIEGGIFSFGYSTLAHLVFMVSYFGIRPMHIVDIKYKYSFVEYRNFGRVTSLVSIFLGFSYILVLFLLKNYSYAKTILLGVLILHGALDGFSDFYECEYQRENNLAMAGQSLFFRIAFFTLTLLLVLFFTQNLIYAEILALVSELIAFHIFNSIRSKNVFKSAVDRKEKEKNLFLESLPLFLIVFCDMYIFSATKFSIDVNLTDAHSGFFNLIFMPTNVIYLVMNLFMKPILTPLSNAYYNNKKEYRKILNKTLLVAFFISLVFVIGTLIFGNIYLNLISFITKNIYNEFLVDSKKLLLIIIIGGCFYTVNTPIYYSLIIENKQKFLVISYMIISIISIFVSKVFVVNLGLIGAAMGFAFNMFLLCIGVVIVKALFGK